MRKNPDYVIVTDLENVFKGDKGDIVKRIVLKGNRIKIYFRDGRVKCFTHGGDNGIVQSQALFDTLMVNSTYVGPSEKNADGVTMSHPNIKGNFEVYDIANDEQSMQVKYNPDHIED